MPAYFIPSLSKLTTNPVFDLNQYGDVNLFKSYTNFCLIKNLKDSPRYKIRTNQEYTWLLDAEDKYTKTNTI